MIKFWGVIERRACPRFGLQPLEIALTAEALEVEDFSQDKTLVGRANYWHVVPTPAERFETEVLGLPLDRNLDLGEADPVVIRGKAFRSQHLMNVRLHSVDQTVPTSRLQTWQAAVNADLAELIRTAARSWHEREMTVRYTRAAGLRTGTIRFTAERIGEVVAGPYDTETAHALAVVLTGEPRSTWDAGIGIAMMAGEVEIRPAEERLAATVWEPRHRSYATYLASVEIARVMTATSHLGGTAIRWG